METSSKLSSEALLNFIHYKDKSDLYYENGIKFLETRPEKASEFFWGSFVLALKALAITRNIRLTEHKEVIDYMYEFVKEIKKEYLRKYIRNMKGLHQNFYEANFTSNEVSDYLHDLNALFKEIKRYYPKEEDIDLSKTTF